MRFINGLALLAVAISLSVGAISANPTTHKQKLSATANKRLQVDLNTTGIAKTTRVEIVKKSPFDSSEEVIHLNGEPMHVRIIFDGKKIESNNDFNKPHLLIYPLPEYLSLFPSERKAMFNKRLNDLKKIIASKSDRGIESLPIMPDSDGHEIFHAQLKCLNFKQGSGIAFISAYSNGDPPLNEGDFFYTFQGLSNDGRHYVSFFWPVKATGLPANSSAKDAEKYVQKLARSKFKPNLDAIDRMVSSISMK